MDFENKVNIYNSIDNEFFNSPPKLKRNTVIHLNIRSMRKNFDSFIAELNQLNNRVDIILLTETWIMSEEVCLFNIPGYRIIANCNNEYRAGGVLCFYNEILNVSEVECNMTTADCLLLEVKFDSFHINTLCIYRFHRFSEYDFINELDFKLLKLSQNTLLLGDLNIDLLKDFPYVNKYKNLMCNNGFVSVVNVPTRITVNSSTCVDHVFIRYRHLNQINCGIFDTGVTDHCLIGLILNINNTFLKHNINVHNNLSQKMYSILKL